jgi:hypothetical protein
MSALVGLKQASRSYENAFRIFDGVAYLGPMPKSPFDPAFRAARLRFLTVPSGSTRSSTTEAGECFLLMWRCGRRCAQCDWPFHCCLSIHHIHMKSANSSLERSKNRCHRHYRRSSQHPAGGHLLLRARMPNKDARDNPIHRHRGIPD